MGGSLSRAPDTRDPSPAEIAFAAGLTALRADRPAEAASSFARAADLGEPGLAEDAAFWNAVALGRSGQPLEARAAFASFLLAHPASPHVGEASVALGWLELDSGHVDEAAARFRAALADPSARIRASAERGLEAVARRQ